MRFTQRRTLASTVHHVVDSNGVTHSRNEEIASQFYSFYSKLYNLESHVHRPILADARSDLIREFLGKYNPRALSTVDRQALEAPLSLEEEWGRP